MKLNSMEPELRKDVEKENDNKKSKPILQMTPKPLHVSWLHWLLLRIISKQNDHDFPCGPAPSVFSTDSQLIECECGVRFCFCCYENWHDPVTCEIKNNGPSVVKATVKLQTGSWHTLKSSQNVKRPSRRMVDATIRVARPETVCTSSVGFVCNRGKVSGCDR
ncbi:hypothetical protein L5515_019689 [Caenorhabditis briggsae]|uniref:IBR domain-containing protein n=1 Tax=Caenorhabditis briggsae TaxID=6238 RepID=A0AAE9FJF4_CAEBR|nr:hypothetical protein L5515_019689 [Caenorhabditis briggsae]